MAIFLYIVSTVAHISFAPVCTAYSTTVNVAQIPPGLGVLFTSTVHSLHDDGRGDGSLNGVGRPAQAQMSDILGNRVRRKCKLPLFNSFFSVQKMNNCFGFGVVIF